jgi:hypothetical protein
MSFLPGIHRTHDTNTAGIALSLPAPILNIIEVSLGYSFNMRSQIKVDEIAEARGRWVDSLNDNDICRLASSFRGGDTCTTFQPRKHGAFNVCFFVEFKSPQQRWVVRIPIPISLPKAMLDEKTEIEVATMR